MLLHFILWMRNRSINKDLQKKNKLIASHFLSTSLPQNQRNILRGEKDNGGFFKTK